MRLRLSRFLPFILCMLIASCAEPDLLRGKWEVTRMEIGGENFTPEVFGSFNYHFRKNGRLEITANGKVSARDYKVEGDMLIDPAQGEPWKMKIEALTNDQMVLSGVTGEGKAFRYHFRRKM